MFACLNSIDKLTPKIPLLADNSSEQEKKRCRVHLKHLSTNEISRCGLGSNELSCMMNTMQIYDISTNDDDDISC